ncbi:MAG: hypothetical protein R3F54_30935 [Alphaproteobacteria bacterium]
MHVINRSLAALSLLALTACAPMAWQKEGASPAEVDVALAECSQLAQDEAWRQSWEARWPPPFYDRRYMPPYYSLRDPFWFDYPSSAELEWDLRNFCMHSKGFRLRPLDHAGNGM